MSTLHPIPMPSIRRMIVGALVAGLLGSGCASRDTGRHPLASTRLWKQYEALPEHRAFVVAGNPTKIWVAGVAGGLPSRDRALRDAKAQCQRQRTKRRLQAPCLTYAEGERVVWEAAGSGTARTKR